MVILLLTIVLPALSAFAETFYLPRQADMFLFPDPSTRLFFLGGTWLVFWACGIRLFLSGFKQVAQPSYTLETIFGIKSDEAAPVVRELGFANLAIGALGIFTFAHLELVMAGAIVGTVFYGAAGWQHSRSGPCNRERNVAMITDFSIALYLAWWLVANLAMSG